MNPRETVQTTAPSFSMEKVRAAKRAIKRRRKEGRGFFIGLLTFSGVIILFLGLIVFQGKNIMIFTFEKFVVNKAFVSLLPADYSLAKTEAIRMEVLDFFEAASEDQVSEAALITVSGSLQEIIRDDHVSEEELVSFLALIRKERARKERTVE